MKKSFFFILLLLCFGNIVQADPFTKVHYDLKNDPIDVVIVSHKKDRRTLDMCIKGIRENCPQVRRTIVVSKKRLTLNGEWFCEKRFPFLIDEVALEICQGDPTIVDEFFTQHKRSAGWYFQQLLKLYSPIVIPNISSNVLVIDADTIFLNPVSFLNSSNGGLFCPSHHSAKRRYINHAKRLVPEYERVHREVYSVCHHMLFQTPILKELFEVVENHHQMPFWKAFCRCVSLETRKGASEYEIYYNYALRHTEQVELRELRWTNCGDLSRMQEFKDQGYHFVSFHTYLRKKLKNAEVQAPAPAPIPVPEPEPEVAKIEIEQK